MREYMEWINQQLREGGYTPEQLERLREILQRLRESGSEYSDTLSDIWDIAREMGYTEDEPPIKEPEVEDSRDIPKYPGDDPTKVPQEGYEWRGKGDVGSNEGNWYNPKTKEWLRPDLDHPAPILPHWDYRAPDGKRYRIFPDDTFESKEIIIVVDKDDWRLQGQEEYLTNNQLTYSEYERHSESWDHDHCAFCNQTFSQYGDDLHEGYCTLDKYHWICEGCYNDFNSMFKWQVVSAGSN